MKKDKINQSLKSQAMPKWRKMSTAPKDGTIILTYCTFAEEHSGIQEMYWDKQEREWSCLGHHPYGNACQDPVGWMETFEAPSFAKPCDVRDILKVEQE